MERMDNFVVILEETCSTWRLVTSVDGLVFRTEVFDRRDNHLRDAVETDCRHLRGQPGSDEAFRVWYTESHTMIKKRFCTDGNDQREKVNNTSTSPEESVHVSSSKSASHFDDNAGNSRSEKRTTRKYTFLGWVVGTLMLIIGGRYALCQKEVVQLFLGKNPVAFYETTEPLCHRLEQRCVHLAHMDSDQNPPFPPEMCRGWCKSGIIASDRCLQFLPFLPKVIPDIMREKPEENLTSHVSESSSERLPIIWEPNGSLTLTLNRMEKLFVNNPGNSSLKIVLTNLVLEGSSYEEIVQFHNGRTEMLLPPHQKRSFEIFIEPTYYDQFKKGSYQGHMTFAVVDGKGQKQTKEYPFSFEVQ